MVHSLGMADASYASVIVRNIRAVRARKNLDQGRVVARMRELGFTNWHRQTLGKVERGERRLFAEEMLGLAYALDTSIEALMAPATDERGYIKLGGGAVHMQHAAARVRGVSDGAIQWNGDTPVFMTKVGGFGEAAERLGAPPDTGEPAEEDLPGPSAEAG
jgi:transcriptional regulator with XRE-family HTH domain